MNAILQILLTAVAVYISTWISPGVAIASFGSAIVVAIVLALLDWIVKPILEFISLPITFLTLGLFMLVINAVIILLAAYFVRSFTVDNFWYAMLFSIIFTIISSFLGWIFNTRKK